MFTACLTILSTLASASAPSSLQLTRVGTYWNRAGVTSVDVFQDTAVFVVGNSLVKAVMDNGVRVVDSIAPPTAHRWDKSKYLDLGSGLGVLSVRFSDGANMGRNDSAIYLVDWSRDRSARRWIASAALGPSGITCNTIDGVATGADRAVFARSEGLFQVRVLPRKGAGRPDSLVVERSLGLPADPFWTDVSLHPRGLVAKSHRSGRIQVWTPVVVGGDSSDFTRMTLVDSSVTDLRGSSGYSLTKSLASGLPGTWMEIHSNGTSGTIHRLGAPTAAGARDIELPHLATDEDRRFGVLPVVARGRSGLMLLAGDSVKALVEPDAEGMPRILATFEEIATIAAAVGDSTLWHATSTTLGAWKISTGRVSSARSLTHRDRNWSLRNLGGRWFVTGSVGTEFSVRSASGRSASTVRIGAEGKAVLPISRSLLLVRAPDGTVATVLPR